MPKAAKVVATSWRRNPKAIKKYTFLHHFLPNQFGGNRAVLLGAKYLVVYALLAIFSLGFLKTLPTVAPGVLGYASDIKVDELLNLTNKKRIESGLGVLTLNSALSEAASGKAKHMFTNDYWAHVSPDGTTPWDFILAEKYDYIYAGENLAKNFNTSKQVVEAWYDSPSHKENLLNKNYTEVGFAVVNGELDGYETTLVVQMFGKARNPSAVATVDTDGSDALTSQGSEELREISESSDLITDTNLAPKVLNPEKIKELANVDLSFSPSDNKFFDVSKTSLAVNLVIIGFVLSLLMLDVWYSSRQGIIKLTGNTMIHIVYFVLAAAGVWLVMAPGRVL